MVAYPFRGRHRCPFPSSVVAILLQFPVLNTVLTPTITPWFDEWADDDGNSPEWKERFYVKWGDSDCGVCCIMPG